MGLKAVPQQWVLEHKEKILSSSPDSVQNIPASSSKFTTMATSRSGAAASMANASEEMMGRTPCS
ncbi:hypothetical protein HK102_010330 [Quaeritorhiza haematococci]|nr:hypothetical protein HK102_010330 [Quaeritorhiza haematococci]